VLQTDDRQINDRQTNGRQHSEPEREFTFAKNGNISETM